MNATRPVVRRSLLALLAAGAIAAPPALPSGTGHSGWSWSSPAPQGENISDLAFVGATGYAVGDFGTLLRSDDGGVTWVGLPSGTTANLTRVNTIASGVISVSGGCAVRRSDDSGATTRRVAFAGLDGACQPTVTDAQFSDASNGLALLSDGTMLSTADGGTSFSRRIAVPGSVAAGGGATATDLLVRSPTSALAVIGGSIYGTNDGANSWTLLSGGGPALYALTPASPTVFYAVGDSGRVVKSTDSGTTWAAAAGAGANLRSIRCASPELCLMTTDTGASIVKTVDGGVSYTQVTPASTAIRTVAFASAVRVVAAGTGGTIVVSDDAGGTWRPVGARVGGAVREVRALASGTPLAWGWGDSGLVVTSGDGGVSWEGGSVPTSAPIRSAGFLNPTTGYALDLSGDLWKTANRGASWQVLDPGPDAGRLSSVVSFGKGRIALLGPSEVRVSVDDGGSFEKITDTLVRKARRNVALFPVRKGLLLGGDRLLFSENGVSKWKAVVRPKLKGKQVTIASIDCTAKGACALYSSARHLYLTTNLGKTWADVTLALPRTATIAAPLVKDVVAVNKKVSYAVLDAGGFGAENLGGWVLRTGDGGKTFQPQLIGRQSLLAGASDGTSDYLLGSEGAIFTTATGGQAGTSTALTLRPSVRAITKPTTVTIRGRLTRAVGGERVTVTASGFGSQTKTVSTNGSFTLSYRVTKTTTFVAHWGGDGVRQGDGSPVVTVTRGR